MLDFSLFTYITYIDEDGKYVDFANGTTIEVSGTTFQNWLAANASDLEGLGVSFRTNNAEEAIGFTAIELGKEYKGKLQISAKTPTK